jgi:uncharacterized repeat protein (TIGR01451 family)
MKKILILLFIAIQLGTLEGQYLFQRMKGKSTSLLGVAIAMNPEGKMLATAESFSGTFTKIIIHNLAGLEYKKVDSVNIFQEVDDIKFSNDGKRIAIISGTNTFRQGLCTVYSISNNKLSQVGSNDEIFELNPKDDFGSGFDFSGDGNSVIVGNPSYLLNGFESSGQVSIYKLGTDLKWKLNGSPISGQFGDRIGEMVAISVDGRRIAFSKGFRETQIYDLINNVWTRTATINRAGKLKFSNDGSFLIVGAYLNMNTVIYEYKNNLWTKISNEIKPNPSLATDYDWNVVDIDLTSDDKHFTLSLLNSSSQKTRFDVVDKIDNVWIPRDSKFYTASRSNYFGIQAQISNDAKMLMLSNPQSNVNGLNSGEVYLYLDEAKSYTYVNAFYDANRNNKLDVGENRLSSARYNVDKSYDVFSTDENGIFISTLAGLHTIEIIPPRDYKTLGDSIVNLNVLSGKIDSINFPIVVRNPITKVNSNFYTNIFVCNTDVGIRQRYVNVGTEDAVIKVIMSDQKKVHKSSLPTPSSNLNGIVQWQFDIPKNSAKSIESIIKIPGAGSIGDTLKINAKVLIINKLTGALIDSAYYDYSNIVRCSFDPNDKAVSPIGLGPQNLTLKDQFLTYKIRFQNTGNFPATDVIVTDKLSTNLDIKTFEITNFSHKITKTELVNNEVKFIFAGINLPDSVNNEPLSHGFVEFRIRPLANLADYSVIQNFANIYFDLNEPIITNTTKSTIVKAFPSIVATKDEDKLEFEMYPNPVYNSIQVLSDDISNSAIEIKNTLGIVIPVDIWKEDNKAEIDCNKLSPGLYFLSITEKNRNIQKVKSFLKF